MKTILILHADGTQGKEDFPDNYSGQRNERSLLKTIVGGDIEHVFVEYEGERTCMVVNEIGAVQDPPLPINRVATHIYHTYPAKRDGIPIDEYYDDAPKVHGDVALLVGVRVT